MESPQSTPPHPVLVLARRLAAGVLQFCKTPSTLRTLLLVVLVLQPLLMYLAWRMHMGFWNYVVLNAVFIAFWRFSVHVYQKAFANTPRD
ncbi:MAG: hypothetical protein LDL30_02990 [Desulfovibrio sp.]|nr:hypothetical protein [Desulfovibrio sp.]MCA1985130.1 hypothetical protein [Desulfovibrio sp.]